MTSIPFLHHLREPDLSRAQVWFHAICSEAVSAFSVVLTKCNLVIQASEDRARPELCVLAACFPLVSENILQTRNCFLPCPYSSSPSPCLHRASTCLLNSAPRYPCLSLQLRHPHPEQGPHHLFRPQAATTPLKAMPASASHWQVWGTREMTDFHSRRVTGWENTSPRKQAQ